MWPSWGLRVDQESLYCTRKFGWFESGWTDTFIMSCIACVWGSGVHLMRPSSSVRDGAILGAPIARLDPADRTTWTPFVAGWSNDGGGLMAVGESSLAFGVDDDATTVVLELGWYNPRPAALGVSVLCGGYVEQFTTELVRGVNELAVQLPDDTNRAVTIVLDGETWSPRSVLGSSDRRRISVDVLGVRPESGPGAARRPAGTAVAVRLGVKGRAKQRLRRALYARS